PDVQHFLGGSQGWSPDGTSIAYAANDREPTEQDVIVRDVATGESRRVFAGDGLYYPMDWSPDGRYLLVLQVHSNTNMDIHLLDVAAESSRLLTEHEEDSKYFPIGWLEDGSGYYLLTDEGREFSGLAFHDLMSGKRDLVHAPEWDIEVAAISADGRWLVWSENEDGYSRVYTQNLPARTEPEGIELPEGVLSTMTLSHSGDKLGVLWAQPCYPTEVFIADLTTGAVNQITHSALGGVVDADLTQPELIRYPTFDDRDIPAFLYRPDGVTGKMPVVLSIHGGPEYQERPTYAYSGLYQYLTSRGIAVLAPNIRGSTGFGKGYQKLIHRDWGGDELKDLDAAVKYLHGCDWVDQDRIGVYGGSFGGFATLSCISRLPDYWAAAVDLVGPSNLVTFAKAIPPTWRRMVASLIGDPETEADFLMERSPITYVDQIRTPLFVIQGANDPRVVKAESDQIVERLRERGVEVRYDVYDDEGHGFTKRENELKAFGDIARFLEERLVPSAT
ncbi:MAG: S9 family peptidase, partial [Chloroflexia bacterium]|nr:S9 family peptidase [Chloroflexia bacterium]